eukprot:6934217-Ditylum_brightwellii.AAC.1
MTIAPHRSVSKLALENQQNFHRNKTLSSTSYHQKKLVNLTSASGLVVLTGKQLVFSAPSRLSDNDDT